MQLGQAIAQIRKERGLTQEAFAKMYNVTRQTVSNWENEKSYPDLSTLVKISDALCGLLHIPYSFRDNDRLSGKDSDLCLYTPYEIPLQILLAVSAPRHGFPYEILPLHPVLSGSLQSSCYYSASISTILHFLINSDFYFRFHSIVYSFSPVASSKPSY